MNKEPTVLAIYTCFDMIVDCREGNPEGWRYFVRSFVAALRRLFSHYGGGDEHIFQLIERLADRANGPLRAMQPMTQREFLDALRPLVLELTAKPTQGTSPDLSLVQEALAPLTAIERQTAWFETFGYPAQEAARIMRMSPETALKLRARTDELLRSKLDDWTAGILATHGRALGAEVEQQPAETQLVYRDFFDVMDGRNSWQHRTMFERTLEESWFEVHRACRIREADDALAQAHPLDNAAAQPILDRLGIEPESTGFWKRLVAGKR